MATSTLFSSHSKFIYPLTVAALVLLAACGQQGDSKAPSASATDARSNLPPCTYVAGRTGKADAALFRAAGEGSISDVLQLLASGGNVNAKDSLKRTPLFAAAFCNRPEMENLLIDKGGSVNARDFLGMSPLHASVLVGGSEAAKALISKGADINLRNSAGVTPLRLAAATHQIVMAELLLEQGANVQANDLDAIAAKSLASKNQYPSVTAAISKLEEEKRNTIQ